MMTRLLAVAAIVSALLLARSAAAELPAAYVVTKDSTEVWRFLEEKQVEAHIVRETILTEVEQYRRTPSRADEPDGEWQLRTTSLSIPAGSLLLKGAEQAKFAEWLEPKGIVANDPNFRRSLKAGEPFPVLRLRETDHILVKRHKWPTSSAPKPLTFDNLYGKNRTDLKGSPAGGFSWRDPKSYFQIKNQQLWVVNAETGQSTAGEYRQKELLQRLQDDLEVDEETGKELRGQVWQYVNRNRSATILTHDNDLYHVPLNGDPIRRLTSTPSREELITWSPDESRIAFVREYDLHTVDLETGAGIQLTGGGSVTLRNGKADWVYFEEIYRRNWRAYRWSPDSQSIAFQQFDDSEVDKYAVIDHTSVKSSIEYERYPLAGGTNPRVRVGVVSLDQPQSVRWIPLREYDPEDTLIAHFDWLPDSSGIDLQVQNRTQTWLDFVRYVLESENERTLFRDQTSAWISTSKTPHYLQDDSFLFLSERNGWQQIYHFRVGDELTCVTPAKRDVSEILHVDEAEQQIIFTGVGGSLAERHLFRCRFDGSGKRQCSTPGASHRVVLSPDGQRFLDTASNATSPPTVTLRSTEGQVLRQVDVNPVYDLERYSLGELEWLQISNRQGRPLSAVLVTPPDFDNRKKYPLWVMTYGGPQAPNVRNDWQSGRLFDRLLVNQGILVLRVDPVSASGDGAQAAWGAYRRLGVSELRDLEDAAAAMVERGFVDEERIGLSGHSYGGFLTAYALTHSTSFSAGIAGAPVTDWRNYDSIYTERYMGLPADNEEGYQETSVVAAAGDLHGRLLLLHGARDDNVHLSNTLQLAHALQNSGKTFDLMIYPRARHGISGNHYRRLMLDFILDSMRPSAERTEH